MHVELILLPAHIVHTYSLISSVHKKLLFAYIVFSIPQIGGAEGR